MLIPREATIANNTGSDRRRVLRETPLLYVQLSLYTSRLDFSFIILAPTKPPALFYLLPWLHNW